MQIEEIGVGSRKGITIILVATGDNYEWFTIKERKNNEKEPWKEKLDVPDAGIDDRQLVLECELVSMNEENCNVVGKIVNCAVEESALTDGKPDAAKMKPICFDPCAHVYRIMGDAVANAFSVGKELHS